MATPDWSTIIDTNYFLEELWFIDHAPDPKFALTKISNVFRDLGFSCYEYTFITNIYDDDLNNRAHFGSSIDDWSTYYKERGFVKEDPCIAHAFGSHDVYEWTEFLERAASGDESCPGRDVFAARR
ncbi:MAG: autoinducer binding domain-containing protein, partial [Pseudomonadota bacterium]